MSAIDQLFETLGRERRKALMPFITAGDPDLPFTAAILKEVIARGAALCEVGIPYSDPIADGPVIQASYTRALQQGVQLDSILSTLGSIAPQIGAPLVTMVSYAIIYRQGLESYADQLVAQGIAGMIVPDLPLEESTQLAAVCRARDLSLIQLVTPTTPNQRALAIAETTSGFLYYVSVAGITGERNVLPAELADRVGWLREQTPLPVCIGFGISQPEHVCQLASVADGLIVGSAIVRRIEGVNAGNRNATIKEVGDYVASLVAALECPTTE